MSAPCCKRGFTLFEILAVVVIAGILMGVSLPRLHASWQTWKVKSFSGDLSRVIMFWRQRAVVDAKVFMMKLEPGRYTVKEQGRTDILGSIAVPSEITVHADKDEIIFYPDGSMSPVVLEFIPGSGPKTVLTTKGVWGGIKTGIS